MATRTRPSTRHGSKRRPPRRRNRGPLVLLLVVAAVGVLVWSIARDVGGDGSSAAAPGVAHVHGLGVNPADGSLHVATHYGTFRIEGDRPAERVGDSFQDTMGFTVAGPDHFLGSGHPDVPAANRGAPRLLGLIESTDAGQSWDPVSLSGKVDFHGLASAHGQVYGWDSTSGRFMVSSDRRTWDTRSTQPLASFAVDPSDADHIVGASPDGLVDSTDGGRTWKSLDGPELVVVSWHKGTGLVGADEDGVVHRSSDGGATWQEGGRLPGPPQAILATADEFYAAADEDGTTGIYRSADKGRTWRLRYRDDA